MSLGKKFSRAIVRTAEEIEKLTDGYERVFGEKALKASDGMSSMEAVSQRVADSAGVRRELIDEKLSVGKSFKKEERRFF